MGLIRGPLGLPLRLCFLKMLQALRQLVETSRLILILLHIWLLDCVSGLPVKVLPFRGARDQVGMPDC